MTRQQPGKLRSIADYRAIRRWLFVLVIGGAVLLTAGGQLAGHHLSQRLLQDGYRDLQLQLERSYLRNVEASLEHQAGHLQVMLHNPAVIEAVRTGDRELLMRQIYWQYQLKHGENPHLEVLHFHDPHNITLLRLHQPAHFGDDLTDIRPMIADANRYQEPRSGFEIGKNGISYRVALPIRDGDEHLGVIEMGVNIAYFTERLAELFGVEVGVIFEAAAMQPYLAEHGQTGLVPVGSDGLILVSQGALLHSAAQQLRASPQRFVSFDEDDKRYVAHKVFTIHNYREEPVATLLVLADVSAQRGLVWRYTLWSSLAWVSLLLLLIIGQYRIFSRMQQTIHGLAFFDPLTALPNRNLLMDRLQQALIGCRRSQRHLALLFLDLDNFKQLNDEHGHHVGDQLLRQVAERLRGCVRANDTIGRQGGDEFVIVLSDLGQEQGAAEQQARMVAQKIVAVLDAPYHLEGGLVYQTSASIGVAICAEERLSLDELLRRADVAMYQAKSAGRNRVALYEGER